MPQVRAHAPLREATPPNWIIPGCMLGPSVVCGAGRFAAEGSSRSSNAVSRVGFSQSHLSVHTQRVSLHLSPKVKTGHWHHTAKTATQKWASHRFNLLVCTVYSVSGLASCMCWAGSSAPCLRACGHRDIWLCCTAIPGPVYMQSPPPPLRNPPPSPSIPSFDPETFPVRPSTQSLADCTSSLGAVRFVTAAILPPIGRHPVAVPRGTRRTQTYLRICHGFQRLRLDSRPRYWPRNHLVPPWSPK